MNLTATPSLALKNIRRQARRSAIALVVISGGVIAFLLSGGFIVWVLENMREWTIHSQLGHIQITRPDFHRTGIADPYQFLLPAKADPSIGAEGHVRTVAPRLVFNGLISKGEDTISFIGEGIDPVAEAPISRAITMIEGTDLTQAGPNSVLLGEGLAANLGAHAGDTVVLLGTTSDGSANAVELKVVGLFQTITKAFDDSALRVPIEVAKRLMKVEGATSWVVLLDDTSKTEAAVSRLRAALPTSDFEVTPWTDLADFYNKTVELFNQQVGVVRILIAFIVILSISNTLTMAVIERTSEIGTSLAIGVRRKGILTLFLYEGLLLGFVGGMLGLGFGILLAELISYIGIPMPPPPGMAHGYTGEITITPLLALEAFLLASLTTLFASIFPAIKASRMNIVDALRQMR